MTMNIDEAAHRLLEKWIYAINTYDLEAVMSLYAADVLFFGTSSQNLLKKTEDIQQYFEQAFINLRPLTASIGEYAVMEITDSTLAISAFDHWSITQSGKIVTANGRLTLVIKKEGAQWKIINFHRSALPVS